MRTKLVLLMVVCFALLVSQAALARYTGGSYDSYGLGTSEEETLSGEPVFCAEKYYGGSYDGYGMGTSNPDIPLPVTLSSFTVQAGDGEVILRWVTESETDNLGFHVYRALEAEGKYARLTAEALEGAGTSTGRRAYAFSDIRLTNGVTYWYKIEDVAFDGARTLHGPISVMVMPQAEEAAQVQALPAEFGLSQNVPNPFNPITEIRYQLPEASHVRLIVYNAAGQRIRTLVEATKEAGSYQVVWNGADDAGNSVAGGMYLIELKAADFVQARRMVLIR